MKRYISILILFLTIFSGKAVAQCTIPRTISGPASVCEGSTGNVYTTETGMSEYAWEVSTGGTITDGGTSASNTVTVTWTTAGARTVKVNYKDTDDCTSASPTTYNVTVNPLPGSAGGITGSAAVCQGDAGVSYSVGTISNASSYVWTYTGTGASITGTSESVTISFSASATGGSLSVHGHNSCGDGSESAALAITVNSPPAAAGSISGSASVCKGESDVAYNVAAISGATGYVWHYTGTGATITGSTESVTISFSALATGGDLTVYGTNGSCSGSVSPALSIAVKSAPAAPGAITGLTGVCKGQTNVAYSITPVSGATSYVWDYSGTGETINGTGSSVTIDFDAAATSGDITVYAKNSCGDGSTGTPLSVTISSAPPAAGTISGDATPCQGESNVTYSITPISGATSYTWAYSGTGASISGSTNSVTVNFAANASGGDLTVYGTNTCGNGSTGTPLTITPDLLPGAAGGISGTSTVCQGQSGVSYTVGVITNATSYTWSYSGLGATITGNSATVSISFSASATGGNLTVRGTNLCGNGTVSANYPITVSNLPATPGTITGTASVCRGASGVTYNVPAITYATGYSWSYDGTGATITGSTQNISISFSESATSGNLSVRGTNTCGTGPAGTSYYITVNPRPSPAIAGPDRACITSTGNVYSTAGSMTNYDWDVSSDGTITTGGGTGNSSVTVTWDDSGSQTVKVNYTDGNGCRAASQVTFPVTVIDKPFPTDIQFTGLLREYATLTASYNYIKDVCFDEVPAETEISWYRADNASGSNAHLITTKPGTEKTFILPSGLSGKYIRMKVKLSDGATLLAERWSPSWLGPVAANEKPKALAVSATGTLLLNNILDGNYTYDDTEDDPEGATSFQWYRDDDGTDAGSSAITGATSQTYAITTADRNKYLKFRVTPKAQTGTSPGDAVNSAWVGPVSDNPPVASSVSISGTTRVSNTLTGNYQYTDVDGDPEGSSVLKWYSATSPTGTGSTEIASGKTLLLTNSLIGSYIGFSVTPVAQAGVSPGTTVTTTTYVGPVFNNPPVAAIQPVTGSLNVNGLLTGHYVYSDAEGDIEGVSTYQWYSSTSPTSGFTAILGETGISHIIKDTEQGRYFRIRVTPVAATGNVLTGSWVESPSYGPSNSQPVASNVKITGTAAVGSTLTGSYDWDDPDKPADSESGSTFRWLRNNTDAIPGATGLMYPVTSADEGYQLSFEVTPGSAPGYPSAGTAVRSAMTAAVIDPSPLKPVASQVCIEGIRAAGQVLRGKYYYDFYKSEGGSTFQWYRDGVSITGATGIQYTLLQVEDIDSNADITFEVTPRSSNVPPKEGAPVSSRPLARIILPKDTYSVSEGDVTLSSNVIDLGGVFSGTGVTGNVFSPKKAGSAGSPYTLTYLLNIPNPAHNCSQQASKLVYVNPNESQFVGFDSVYCHNGGPDVISVSGVPTGPLTTILGFTCTDPDGIRSQSGTMVTIDPAYMRPGIYKDVLYFSYINLGTFYQISQSFRIDSVGTKIKILNLDKAYCQNDPKKYISIENMYPVGGTAVWTGDILSDTKPASAYADPALGTPGSSYPVSYKYRSPLGCYSALLKDTVKINRLPDPYFPLDSTYNIAGGYIPLVPNQPGGTFTGNGVSGDRMFPDIAGLGLHEIKYSIVDSNLCSAVYSDKTTIREALGKIDILSPICYSKTVYNVKVTGLPTVGKVSITGFTNKKNTLVYNPGDIDADYSVPAAGPGADTLFFTYKWDDVDYSLSEAIYIDSIGQPYIKNLSSSDLICTNKAPYELFPSITGGVFTGPVSGSYLDPTKALGPAVVTYTYTNKATGCSKDTSVNITIYPAPQVDFVPADVCIESKSDTTFFVNNTLSSDPIQEWLWEFADESGTKKSTKKDAGYLYKIGGLQKITLTATTVNNCAVTKESTFNFGVRPDADFYWKKDCMHPDDSIILIDTTYSTSPIASRSWNVLGTEFSTADKEARYPKTDTGFLAVTYVVRTSYANCYDTVTKNIYIKPSIVIPVDGYFENFESGNGGWIKGETTGNSWAFGTPDRPAIKTAYSGDHAWVTNFSGSGLNQESSSIVSPCFDFTTVERPEIRLELYKIFTRDIDGAVLQYRIGNDKEWHSVGAIDDGINWYNSAVIRGEPGGNPMGWTTRGEPDNKWNPSIHTLDELNGKSDVVFRIAYASDGMNMKNDGIAFDDIWIGERSRKILLEHFTNITDESGFNSDALVNAIARSRNEDVINIQYHANFPRTDDPYYLNNQGDAGARILFYGLTRTPYTFIDGGTDDENYATYFSYMNNASKIDSNYVIKRSLIPSLFDIDLATDITNNILSVGAAIKALDNVSTENLTLFIAVTEQKDTINIGSGEKVFSNVFRKFIPDAGGLQLKNSWVKGESISIAGQSWALDPIMKHAKIEVIAFIQDAISKKVYQAFSSIQPDIFVGIESPEGRKKADFILYPNPAVNRLTIEFSEPLTGETDIRIYDIQGLPVLTLKAESGLYEYTIDNLSLKQGLYMVRISRKGIDLGSRKLVVSGR